MKMLEDLEEVVPGELDKTSPAIIWLQIDNTGDNNDRSEPWPGTDGVTWQDDSIGGQEIQYVRADLYRDIAARLEAAERDASIGRYVLGYAEWIRDEGDTLMAIRLPERADLSSVGTRRDAITKAMQETGR